MYKLYYSPGKANLAPHMLLEELGVDYDLVLVDTDNGEHLAGEYLKLNPTGRIPVLIDGDLVLHETAAICLHLADRHSEAGLAPALGTVERANFYKWLFYLSNTLQPELITYFYADRLTDDESMTTCVKVHAQERISAMLDICETALVENDAADRGPYLLGARYSAVDPYLMMLARWTRGMQKPARTRPHFGRYLDMLAARPAIQRTFAQEGLDAPLY